jgi:phage shock protein PspC (stress-responsive transcriptional regulator)
MRFSQTYKPLFRSQQQHLLGGVCSGIAEYFNIDPTWVRAAFLISTLVFFTLTVLVYTLLWILIPRSTHTAQKTPQPLEAHQLLQQPTEENPTPQALIASPQYDAGPLPPLTDMLAAHQEKPQTTSPRTQPKAYDSPDNNISNPFVDTVSSPAKTENFLMDDANFSNDFLNSFEDDLSTTSHNDITSNSEQQDDLDAFSKEFLASLEEATSPTDNSNTTPLPSSFDEFPDDFMKSFNDEDPTTEQSQQTTTKLSDGFENFPDDFLQSFSEEDTDDKPPQTTEKLSDSFEDFPAEFLDSFNEKED